MSDQNTTTTEQATVETNGEATTPCVLYATRAECEAAKPADAPKSLKVFTVSKAGAVVGYMLGRGYDPCLGALARRDGYTVSLGAKTAPVTKESMTAALEAMSADDRAAFLAKYLPAPTVPTVPAPTGRKRNSPTPASGTGTA